MKKLCTGILGLGLTSVVALASANAADMYRPDYGGMKDGPVYVPVNTWTGLYAGVNGGFAWGANDHQLANTQDPFGGLSPEGGFGGGRSATTSRAVSALARI